MYNETLRLMLDPLLERMILPGGSKLGKNETNDADTLLIHDTAVRLHFRLDCLFTVKAGQAYPLRFH